MLEAGFGSFAHTHFSCGQPSVVCALLEARGRSDPRVFPVDITQAWHTAIDRAGIANFRFHDLRHSCGSAMVQNGANLAEVARQVAKDIVAAIAD